MIDRLFGGFPRRRVVEDRLPNPPGGTGVVTTIANGGTTVKS